MVTTQIKVINDKPGSEKSESVQENVTEESGQQNPSPEAVPAEEVAQQAPVENGLVDGQAPDVKEGSAEQEPEVSTEEKNDAPDENSTGDIAEKIAEASDENEESATSGASETIRKMAESPAVLPGESGQNEMPKDTALGDPAKFLSVCVKDVMQKELVWAGPEDSVQQALAQMQQHDAGYLLIGLDGALEGIVSKSDIAGAISPYLRTAFSKWRRPSDDATLKIKVKWIMSRPVRTMRPETSLVAVMENMCRFGGRAIPVADDQGNVQGIVTVFDIFRSLLSAGAGVSTLGTTPQAPPLV